MNNNYCKFVFKYHCRSKYLIWQQIESFNDFLNKNLKKIVYSVHPEDSRDFDSISYRLNNLSLGVTSILGDLTENPITPNECRMRDISYSAPIFLNVCYKVKKNFFRHTNFVLCYLPIMVHSRNCVLVNRNENFFFIKKECPLDPGGYFIIKGAERVILIQEQLFVNRISIEKDSSGNILAKIISCFENRRAKNSVVLRNKKLFFRSSIFSEDVPLFVIFKAFGFTEDADIVQIIGASFEPILELSIYETKILGIITQKQAVFFLNEKLNSSIFKYKRRENSNLLNTNKSTYNFMSELFLKNILIHIHGRNESIDFSQKKAVFICIMVRRLLISLDYPIYIDDKDYYGNKRLELSGYLISIVFEDLFKKAVQEMEKKVLYLTNKLKNKNSYFPFFYYRSDIISNGLEYTLSTGNWRIQKFKQEKSGITQILTRLSFISTLGMINRVSSTCEKVRKASGPRALHSSQWGIICPSDTPEGESCGLVKNLTIFANITINQNDKLIMKVCYDLGVNEFDFTFGIKPGKISHPLDMILLNNTYIGFHLNASKFVFTLRNLRRKGMIGKYVSVFWDTIDRVVSIVTDSGRASRPLLIVENGECRIKFFRKNIDLTKIYLWRNLEREGFIEFLDINEQNNAVIANKLQSLNLDTTHVEISPEIILGICSSIIPFPAHNQSPRNTYQCAMGKQAVGSISYNQNYRNDALLSILLYCQKPIVKTKMVGLSGNNRLTSGINACVCIMSYSGYDIEDAIVMNRSSIERGFFRSFLFKKNKFNLKNKVIDGFYDTNQTEKNLYTTGVKMLGVKKKLETFDEYLRKYIYPLTSVGTQDSFFSSLSRKNHSGRIQTIILSTNSQDPFFIKIILRQTRIPEIGDKFSSRHGQKGICGLISAHQNLPFSNQGIIPDLIMNPHGFPSRMTVGKMIEITSSKISAQHGKFFNGTPFHKFDLKVMKNELIKLGFGENCKDFFFSGITGNLLNMCVFSSLVFYQKLKHMVRDKIHGRSRGPRSILTRQPIDGRSKGGGLRFGEMEKDCLVSYGASELLIERLMISSDVFLAKFDLKTGLIISGDSNFDVVTIKLPYACKLLFQELHSMNIVPKLRMNYSSSDL